jgi:flagellin
MSLVVNTNVGSLNAQRSLASSSAELKTAMERLSSGSKINSAADDAAGFAISERMTAQIRGLNMAAKNAGDGLSMLSAIENATNDVTDMLQRMRELAVQAVNDTNSQQDRKYLQTEVAGLIAEIDRVASQTQYNGQNILDGTMSGKIQVGTESGQTVGFSVSGISSKNLSIEKGGYKVDGIVKTAVASAPAPGSNSTSTAEDVAITTSTGTTWVAAYGGGSAKQMADDINAVSNSTGVSATALTEAMLSSGSSSANLTTLKINGVETASFAISNGQYSDAIQKINDISNSTGVTAKLSGGNLILSDLSGEDLTIENSGSITSLSVTAIGDMAGGLATSLSAAGGNDSTRVMGKVSLYSESEFSVAQAGTVALGYFSATQTAVKFGVDLVNDASASLAKVTSAIEQVAGDRAQYGALQNRLEYTVSNLLNVSEFTTAARSRIADADFAAESAKLAKAQVLQQSGTAMLAQANASSQLALSLVR